MKAGLNQRTLRIGPFKPEEEINGRESAREQNKEGVTEI
jgi:hypothetical protein